MPEERLLPTAQSTDLPTFTIASDGAELPGTFNVASIQVSRTVNRIPVARITLIDGDAAGEDFPLSNRAELAPGREIEIRAGYHNDNQRIFRGLIVHQRARIKENRENTLVIECKDRAYGMTVGRRNRYFRDLTDSDAIEEILQQRGLPARVDSTEVRHAELVQYHCTDWDFIVSRAELNGKMVAADDGELRVAAPDFSGEPVSLRFGATILALDATLDATHQHETVACSAWDPAGQQMAESEARQPQIREAGNLVSADLSGAVSDGDRRHQNSGSLSGDETQSWADALRIKNVLSKLRGVVQCKGLPQLLPGQIIELAGVGDRFNGPHYVSGVRHEIAEGSWQTDIQFGLWPELFTEQHDTSEIPASGLLPAVSGLQVGLVTQLEADPAGEHRILVRMPAVDPNAEGTWARVARLDAGADRGTFFLPEINDEVLLGFLNDDPRHPVVLGMLHSSSKPAPVAASDDNHEKGFYTRSKLRMVFDDDLKSIVIDTPKGNRIELSEDAGSVRIADEKGNKILLDSDGITLDSSGDIQIRAAGDLKLEGVNLQLKAGAGFKAEGNSGAELSSAATTTIRGSFVNIN